jgi:hypothetical protein
MSRLHASGLLLLGCLTAAASAQDVQWRPASKRVNPAATAPASPPTVELGRPVAQKPARVDPQLTQTSFQAPAGPARPRVVRLQDEEQPLPEPQWPTEEELKQPPAKDAPEGPILPPPTEVVPPTAPPPTGGTPVPAVPPAPPLPCGPECCLAGAPTVCRPCPLYGGGEYLLWWIKDPRLPPLVTTGPVASQGILGMPGTVVLFGGSHVDMEERSGGRFTLGSWLDPCQTWGLEGTFFFLGERASRFGATSDQFLLLARPFFNVNTGTQFAEIVTAPGRAAGGIGILLPSELWGAEANLRRNVCRGCNGRFDLLAGFRYLDLHEGVNILEMGTVLPGGGQFAGSTFRVADNFDTRNQFYGGQLGAETELRRGRWFVNCRGKVALGANHETVNIVGTQTLTAPAGGVDRFRGGLLALPSNSGHFTRDHFAVVPEAGVNVGCQITGGLRAYVGYTFLYWNNVLRPGDQIDRVLDVNQIPNFMPGPPAGQVRPVVPFRQTDFWAQGINFGLEWRY